jgi:hypothetical protein
MLSKQVATILCSIMLAAGCTSLPPPPAAQPADFGVLSGTWEGSFQVTTQTEYPPYVSEVIIRLVLENGVATLFAKNDKDDTEWKDVPGPYTVEYLGRNVLVYLIHAGKVPKPKGHKWNETYLIAGTAVTDSKLLVRWLRVVNNIDAQLSDNDRAFTIDGEGILERIPSGQERTEHPATR